MDYKVSKEAYVNRYTPRQTEKNIDKAAETSVNKGVQATYKGTVKNATDAAIDRIQGDTPEGNKDQEGLARDEWVNKFQANP